jgi:hypothetical protein
VQAYIKYGRLRETKQKHPAGVTMQVLAVRPKSRGSVGLSSLDPLNGSNFDMPKVWCTAFVAVVQAVFMGFYIRASGCLLAISMMNVEFNNQPGCCEYLQTFSRVSSSGRGYAQRRTYAHIAVLRAYLVWHTLQQ